MKRILSNTLNWFQKKYKIEEETKEVKGREEMEDELYWEMLQILVEMKECDCLEEGRDEILLREYYRKEVESKEETQEEKEVKKLEQEVNQLTNRIEELELLNEKKENNSKDKLVRVVPL